jgi:hypothetical protein
MRSILFAALAPALLASSVHGQAIDPNARNMHVFPQVADGIFGDGSEYLTTFVVTNVSAGFSSCSIALTELTSPASRLDTTNFGVPINGIAIVETTGEIAGDTGYAIIDCNLQVTAIAVFARAISGKAEGMATVFSTPAMTRGRVPVIQGDGVRTGIAIINDTLFPQTYTLTLYDADGIVENVRTLNIEAREQRVAFADESAFFEGDVPTAAGPRFEGSIVVSGGGQFHAIGLAFEGGVFTAVPFSIF